MKKFLQNIYGEMKHVVWPTQNQTFWYTFVTVVFTFAVAYYLGGLDWVFAQLLQLIV